MRKKNLWLTAPKGSTILLNNNNNDNIKYNSVLTFNYFNSKPLI